MDMQDKITTLFIAVAVIAAGIYGGGIIANNLKDSAQDPTVSDVNRNVNVYAKISGTGDPLPSDAREDLEITLTYIDAAQDTDDILFELDYPSNWQATTRSAEGDITILKVDDKYYGLDPDIVDLWTELTLEQSQQFFSEDGFYLNSDLITEFNTTAIRIADEPCDGILCVVWESEYLGDGELLTVRVNKQTRKISSVTGVNDIGFFNMVYTYRDVDLSAPNQADQFVPDQE